MVPLQPEWGITMHLSNNTTINWGPWCDRQRDLIWRFFNPISHKEWQTPTEPELRRFKFDLEFSAKLDGKRNKNMKKGEIKQNRINFEFLGSMGQKVGFILL